MPGFVPTPGDTSPPPTVGGGFILTPGEPTGGSPPVLPAPSVPKGAPKPKARPNSRNAGTPTYTYFQQPAFDPRIRSLEFPMLGGENTLTRGFMIWAKPFSTGGYGSKKAAVQFLYNPTTVTASYSTDGNDAAAKAQQFRAPDDIAAVVTPMAQGVSFSLYFDRTFEIWSSPGDPNVAGTGGADLANPAINGVATDVLALQEITGQLIGAQSNASAGSKNASGGSTTNTPIASTQGPMMMLPTWLFFGSLSGGLNYYGFINDFTVTYTHFSQFMVPMRCTVSVNFALLMPPPNASTPSDPSSPQSAQSYNNLWTNSKLGGGTGGLENKSDAQTGAGGR